MHEERSYDLLLALGIVLKVCLSFSMAGADSTMSNGAAALRNFFWINIFIIMYIFRKKIENIFILLS
jgi:hypothetical protein